MESNLAAEFADFLRCTGRTDVTMLGGHIFLPAREYSNVLQTYTRIVTELFIVPRESLLGAYRIPSGDRNSLPSDSHPLSQRTILRGEMISLKP